MRSSLCCSNLQGCPPSPRSETVWFDCFHFYVEYFWILWLSLVLTDETQKHNTKNCLLHLLEFSLCWWAQISCLFTFPNVCNDMVVTACVFPAERFPAGRRLFQLLQCPDGAPAEAERRAHGFRQPSDWREERSEEPHAPIGGRAPTLPAGWTGTRRQCEYMTGNTTDTDTVWLYWLSLTLSIVEVDTVEWYLRY